MRQRSEGGGSRPSFWLQMDGVGKVRVFGFLSLPPSLRSFIVIVGLQGGVCDDGLESPFTDACLIQYKFKKDGKCTL